MKAFSDILREVTGGVEPLCTVREVAGVMRVHEQTIYSYINDHTEPSYSKIAALSHYLISKHSYFGLAVQFMLPCGARANGRVEDDLLAIYDAGTDAHRAFSNGDQRGFEEAIARMKGELRDLEAEGNESL